MPGIRDIPLLVNVVLALVLAGLVIGVGLFTPGLPLQNQKAELATLEQQLGELEKKVAKLEDARAQLTKLKNDIASLKRQLEVMKTIVPEEKEVDDFMRIVHKHAAGSNVSIRRITTKPVAVKEYYNELPFEIEFDGQYFAVLSFFEKIGRESRVINVSDLNFASPTAEKGKSKYPIRPGTTVLATATATTFFTKQPEPSELPPAKAKGPGKVPGKQPGK